jgi:type II secretory pathway pseudopilin PulG
MNRACVEALTQREHRKSAEALTLIELLTVIGVVAVFAALLVPVTSAMRARAQRAQCTANLRNLYNAANLYVQQNGSWPQISMEDGGDNNFQDYARGWVAALAPFGPTQQTWICPTIQNRMGNPRYWEPDNVRIDYYAMAFGDKPMSPHKCGRHPWFVETADVHGHGNLVIFADGSVSDLKTVRSSPRKRNRANHVRHRTDSPFGENQHE